VDAYGLMVEKTLIIYILAHSV